MIEKIDKKERNIKAVIIIHDIAFTNVMGPEVIFKSLAN